MAGSESLYCSLLLIGVVTVVCGNEDMRDALNQISQLQADLLGKIVPSYIHNQVEQALTRILGDQYYERVRHLKHSQQQMKRHIHSMERRLKTVEDYGDAKMRTIVRLQKEHQQCEVRMEDLQREVNSSQLHVSNVYSELKQKVNSTQFKLYDVEDYFSKILNNVTSLSKVVNNSMERRLKTLEDDRDEKTRTIDRLQEKHQQCEVRMQDLEREVNSSQLHVSNVYSELKQEVNSTQFKLDDIEDNFSKILNNVTLLRKFVDNKMDNISRYCSCVDKTMSSTDTSLTHPPTPVTTVTPRVVEEMNRILVIQRLSSTVQYPHQIDLHSNDMSTYPYLRTSHIISSTYDPISRRIIFSRWSPEGIYSSRLDVGEVETVKHNVMSLGIVVDADRGIVFLTTYRPRKTISRMTTTGNDFRGVVDLTGKLSYVPRGIAIDGRQRVIYVCAWDRLLSVDYDGKNLSTLQRGGKDIFTVIFDESRGSVFFNVDKKVMMKSLATDRNTEIMELGYNIRKFVLYNNSLYVSSRLAGGNIGAIHLESNIYSNLKNMEHNDNVIILVP